MMRKGFSILMMAILFIALHPVPPVIASEEVRVFSDVPSTHWAYQDVMSGVRKGYINGLPDGTFAPERQVSRAELIKMVVAALELPVESQLPDEPWYLPYTKAALNEGLIGQNEYADGNFAKRMTRMEMVRVAVKAADETMRGDNRLDAEIMLNAVEKGIIRGINGKLVPEGFTTRAQAVAVIERMLAVRAGQTLETDQQALEVAEIEHKIAKGDIWEPYGPDQRILDLEVGRYYEMLVHESFYVKDGYLHGYLPELPEGLEYSLGFRVEYDPKDKVNATNGYYLNYDYDLKPGEKFKLPIPHADKVKGMYLFVAVEVSENGSVRRSSIMDFYNNRQIKETVKY